MTRTDTEPFRDDPGQEFRGFRFSDLYWYLVLTAVAFVLALLQPIAWAQQPAPQADAIDPPGRVARLNLAEGPVSFAPGDANDAWTAASLNRPLTGGDRLWTGPQARAEVYAGSTAVRMNGQTSLDLLALDDNNTQLRLAQGTLKLRVRQLFEGQRLEVDTPNLAFAVSQPGDYRLDVDPAGNTTRVIAQTGSGVIYGDNSTSVNLAAGQQANFSGTQLVPAGPGASRQDDFDLWAANRDRLEDQSVSARYVPRETVGYQQLDNYGNWSQDPSYGAVWIPRAVPVNWAPYRMRRNSNDLNEQGVGDNLVDHAPLLVQSRGAEALPLAAQGFVAKALDCTKPLGTRQHGDVLPLLVALENVERDTAAGQFLVDVAMLFDAPHTQ